MINLFNIPLNENLNTFYTNCSNLIIYHITYIDECPFIQILLSYDSNKKSFVFPECSKYTSLQEIIGYCNEILESFLMKKCNIRDILFKGVYTKDNSSYCVIEISNVKLFNLFSYSSDIYSLTTLPEIIYNKKNFERNIHENLVVYFKKNLRYYLLKDNGGNFFPLPTIGYIIQSSQIARYTNIFGILDYSNNKIVFYSSFDQVIKYNRCCKENISCEINKMVIFGNIDLDTSNHHECDIRINMGHLNLFTKNNAYPLSCFVCN